MRKTANGQSVPINVVGSSKFGIYKKISAEVTYNMFISDDWLVNFPGYQRVLEFLPNGEGRGGFVSTRGGFLLVVINSSVFRVSNVFGITQVGTLTTSSGEVFIDENLDSQICIVDGTNAYIYNWFINGFSVQTDPTFGSVLIPAYVTFHNKFFLFGNASTAAGGGYTWWIFISNVPTPLQLVLYGGTAVTASLSLTTKPDFALAVIRIPSQADNVLVFGGTVCEVFTNTTAVAGALPYRRNSSLSIDTGCLSINTICSNDDKIVWLGVNDSNTPVITVFTGQDSNRISTDGIDSVLSQLKYPQQSTAIFYRHDGHLFYQITFFNPVDNLSLIYDFNTEKFFHVSDQNLDHHPARISFYFNNSNYFLSINNACLYVWSTQITQIIEDIADGIIPVDPRLVYDMQRIRICETFRAEKTTPFVANTFVITIDQGNDTTPSVQECLVYMVDENNVRMFSENNIQIVPEGAGQEDCDETPYQGRVDLSISIDGGETFSNEVSRYTNTLGNRRNIMFWERMGWCNEWTAKLRFWIGGRIAVSGGILDITAAGGEQ